MPPNRAFHLKNVELLMPWRRQTSAVAIPCSCSRRFAMICSSVTRIFFIVQLLLSRPSDSTHFESVCGAHTNIYKRR